MDESPWTMGRLAYIEGAAKSECPYRPDDPDGIDWESGWLAAEEEEEEFDGWS